MKAFKKIPKDVLFSPGGILLITFAALIELLDLIIPIPFLDQIIEIPLEIIFCILLIEIANVSISDLIIPFLIERIPGISDLVPSWLIRLFF